MDDGSRLEDDPSAFLGDQDLPCFIEYPSSDGRAQLGKRSGLLEQLLSAERTRDFAHSVERPALHGGRCRRDRRRLGGFFVWALSHALRIQTGADTTQSLTSQNLVVS